MQPGRTVRKNLFYPVRDSILILYAKQILEKHNRRIEWKN
jgi:hypothetical protein